jgi:phosphoribosylaminoimidazole (AIR) synthetase
MFKVFNMGIGMVVFCDAGKADDFGRAIPESICIGEVVSTANDNQVILD